MTQRACVVRVPVGRVGRAPSGGSMHRVSRGCILVNESRRMVEAFFKRDLIVT
jgi:hypothetical protein